MIIEYKAKIKTIKKAKDSQDYIINFSYINAENKVEDHFCFLKKENHNFSKLFNKISNIIKKYKGVSIRDKERNGLLSICVYRVFQTDYINEVHLFDNYEKIKKLKKEIDLQEQALINS
jgi:hypothetical protein